MTSRVPAMANGMNAGSVLVMPYAGGKEKTGIAIRRIRGNGAKRTKKWFGSTNTLTLKVQKGEPETAPKPPRNGALLRGPKNVLDVAVRERRYTHIMRIIRGLWTYVGSAKGVTSSSTESKGAKNRLSQYRDRKEAKHEVLATLTK